MNKKMLLTIIFILIFPFVFCACSPREKNVEDNVNNNEIISQEETQQDEGEISQDEGKISQNESEISQDESGSDNGIELPQIPRKKD